MLVSRHFKRNDRKFPKRKQESPEHKWQSNKADWLFFSALPWQSLIHFRMFEAPFLSSATGYFRQMGPETDQPRIQMAVGRSFSFSGDSCTSTRPNTSASSCPTSHAVSGGNRSGFSLPALCCLRGKRILFKNVFSAKERKFLSTISGSLKIGNQCAEHNKPLSNSTAGPYKGCPSSENTQTEWTSHCNTSKTHCV